MVAFFIINFKGLHLIAGACTHCWTACWIEAQKGGELFLQPILSPLIPSAIGKADPFRLLPRRFPHLSCGLVLSLYLHAKYLNFSAWDHEQVEAAFAIMLFAHE